MPTAKTIAEEMPPAPTLFGRKKAVFENAEKMATVRGDWIQKNSAYYDDDYRYLRFIIPEGARVIDLGCGAGDLLAALKPSHGVGVDFSPAMISQAKARHPELTFIEGDIENEAVLESIEGPFDFVVISDTIGQVEDIEQTLRNIHHLCTPATRLVIAYFSPLWEPAINLGTKLGRRMPQPENNHLTATDFLNILDLSDFEPIRMETRQLIPYNLLGIGRFVNRFIAPLPGIRKLCLRTYTIARPVMRHVEQNLSTTILIPCRNESGNIERAIKEMPRFGRHQEIMFVEGNSKDDTYEECLRVQKAYEGVWDIKVLRQDGKGKGDAVRKGFNAATGDILMILDADLTVPAAEMPKFYRAIATGKGEFINGTRLVYPMESEAMRFLNHLANKAFALIFSYLLNQRFTDTLCGTKVLLRSSYLRIADDRKYFGDFDPFGDFDLIFGAAKQSLKMVEVPVPYKARTYGETQISRFRDGVLLLKMVLFAFRKLKAI